MANALVNLLEFCLEDQQEDRPADAGVLAQQLAALLEPKPKPQPEPPPPPPQPKPPARLVTNVLGMTLVRIEPGTFTMGSPRPRSTSS